MSLFSIGEKYCTSLAVNPVDRKLAAPCVPADASASRPPYSTLIIPAIPPFTSAEIAAKGALKREW